MHLHRSKCDLFELQKQAVLEEYESRKNKFLSDEEEKLKNWSEDKKRALELEIISYDDLIKDAGKKSNDLAQKLKMMKTAKLLRQKQMELQRMLFRLQEAIDTDCQPHRRSPRLNESRNRRGRTLYN